VLAAGAEAASGAFGPRLCGSITVLRKGGNDYSYRLKVFVAPVECATAQKIMSAFIMRGAVPRRWFCRRGHSADRWAAACARTGSRQPIVRAYLIAG
jgi:hypothetical protein